MKKWIFIVLGGLVAVYVLFVLIMSICSGTSHRGDEESKSHRGDEESKPFSIKVE